MRAVLSDVYFENFCDHVCACMHVCMSVFDSFVCFFCPTGRFAVSDNRRVRAGFAVGASDCSYIYTYIYTYIYIFGIMYTWYVFGLNLRLEAST